MSPLIDRPLHSYPIPTPALLRIDAERMNYFLHTQIDPKAPNKVQLGKGLPASPGATTGEVVFTPEEAEAMVKVLTVLLRLREDWGWC